MPPIRRPSSPPGRRLPVPLALLLLLPVVAAHAQPPDLEALEAGLREAEIAFATSVEEKDFDAFVAMLHPTATFGGGSRVLRGRDAVAETWRAAYFAPDSPTLRWRPRTVLVATDGELGLSTGPYESTRSGPSGEAVTVDGVFFSVWRRVEGEWRIVLDGGTPGVPREPADDEQPRDP